MPPFRHILSQPVVDTNNTENTKNTRTNMQTSLNKPQDSSAIRHALKPPCVCSYCDAKLFSGETGGICCVSGKIKLASTEHAAPLSDLFIRLDKMGNEFRVNICAYNSVFAFMSMGDGVYTFRVHGGIYHSIESLLPDNETPKFLQLYINDTENETENRLTIMRIMAWINKYITLQQLRKLLYIVDNYVKIEFERLNYLRLNQDKLCRELYQGLHDSYHSGVTDASKVGAWTILPSSFIESPRDLYQQYQDSMALVQTFGMPDLFITVTCNPKEYF
ncbi:13668_t:CDS:2 [Dentiscutata erythropus]|uniref:13668_t:CDS:1 n=1 Tax=Dentiscutata erythropus TaxID=1348616 RepID=A0A9N9D4T6_9GLOM|nr:13668_t:CDS:2 [Dentiscutata erythropus]